MWCFVVATGAARSSMRRRWVRCFMTSMRSRRVGRECTSCAHRSARWADSHADSGLALRDGPKSLSKKAWRSATKLLARDRTESAVVPHKCKTMCLDTQPRNKTKLPSSFPALVAARCGEPSTHRVVLTVTVAHRRPGSHSHVHHIARAESLRFRQIRAHCRAPAVCGRAVARR